MVFFSYNLFRKSIAFLAVVLFLQVNSIFCNDPTGGRGGIEGDNPNSIPPLQYFALKSCCKDQGSLSINGSCIRNLKTKPFPEKIQLGEDFFITFEQIKILPGYKKNNGIDKRCKNPKYSTKSYVIKKISNDDGDNGNSGDIYLHEDKSLELTKASGTNVTIYLEHGYCIDSVTQTSSQDGYNLRIYTPEPECLSSRPPFRKCCNWDFPASLSPAFGCDRYQSLLDLKSLEDIYDKSARDAGLNAFNDLVAFASYHPKCQSRLTSVTAPDFRITKSGTVEILWDAISWIELKEFCLDQLTPFKSMNISNGHPVSEKQKNNFVLVYCTTEVAKKLRPYVIAQMIYCAISCVFILLTLWIYLILWRKHSLNGWTQFAFLVTAFTYFFMRLIRRGIELANDHHLSTIYPDRIDSFFTYLLLTNLVMLSLHMLWTFINIQPEQIVRHWRDLKRLYISEAVCFVLAFLIPSIELITGFETAMKIQKYILIFLLGLNIVIVLATGWIVWHKLKTHHANISGKSSLDPKMMAKMFLKLFCITGMIWSLKIVEQTSREHSFETGWFWGSIQFITYTYGVILFFVFACSPKILNGLEEKFPQLKKLSWNLKKTEQEQFSQTTSLAPVGGAKMYSTMK